MILHCFPTAAVDNLGFIAHQVTEYKIHQHHIQIAVDLMLGIVQLAFKNVFQVV